MTYFTQIHYLSACFYSSRADYSVFVLDTIAVRRACEVFKTQNTPARRELPTNNFSSYSEGIIDITSGGGRKPL